MVLALIALPLFKYQGILVKAVEISIKYLAECSFLAVAPSFVYPLRESKDLRGQ